MIQWVQHKWRCGTNASKVVRNLLKVTHVLEDLQQTEHLRTLSVYGLQSTKTGDPGYSGPLQPRFGSLQLLAFPKTKLTFEREEISDCRRDSGKYNGIDDGNCSKGFCRMSYIFLISISKFQRPLAFLTKYGILLDSELEFTVYTFTASRVVRECEAACALLALLCLPIPNN